ncbi:unnamed protein product [Triticum turgidum subsp. durum]|uniref:RST domain-containing protein n=1 Tax=Triticum turgidum subsp. durum TaxID=4567 RepID=A0A9R0WDS3_TRITD|nr:unnamed protein product [Triticum turgidum subsp. durum]
MDFSGDVKQAIPRPAVAFGGVGSAGPSPLLRGWREFRRSGAPVRFLCFEGGAWADVEGEAAVPLRRAFLDGRVVAEAAYGGREFLFDFLRMVRIDAGTAEEVAMGWIDDRGACFFPVPDSGRKRKRGEPELEDGASSGVEERSDESSDTVESGRVSKAARGAWGRAVRLEETDKFYQVVKKLFLSGIAPRVGGGVAITAVHKVAQGPRCRASQLHPSSDNYDSAVDNMQSPQWYVVWSKDMNTRILPEYVVSFKCPSLHQMQGSSEATSQLKKPSPVARDMFPTLLAEIQRFVPSSKLQTLQGTYNRFKKGQMKKDQFIRFLRAFIGDRVLTAVAKKLRGY